jgi:peptide/nickel transport system substrate-binding protein
MLLDVGLKVRLQWYEAAQKNRMQYKPFFEDRPPQIIVDQHDNNTGDAVFSLYGRWHSGGTQSKTEDPYIDFLIDYGSQQTGELRTTLFQRAHERIVNGAIADAMLFHMVGYAAVGPRIDYQPVLETNSAVRIADIGLVK